MLRTKKSKVAALFSLVVLVGALAVSQHTSVSRNDPKTHQTSVKANEAAEKTKASPTQPEKGTKTKSHAKSTKDESGSSIYRKVVFWFSEFIDDKVAVVTLLLVVAVGLQYWSMLHQEQTSKRQSRGYIGIVAGEARALSNDKILVWIGLKNGGQTPAHDVTMWFSAAVLGIKPREKEFFESHHEDKGWVMVHDATWIRHKTIEPADVAAVRSGQKRVWVWGRFDYVDSFGERCWGEFRYWNGYEHSRVMPHGNVEDYWALIPEKEGNRAQYGEKTAT